MAKKRLCCSAFGKIYYAKVNDRGIITEQKSEAPYLSKVDILEVLKADGIEPPRLYAMGFAHNNCGCFVDSD